MNILKRIFLFYLWKRVKFQRGNLTKARDIFKTEAEHKDWTEEARDLISGLHEQKNVDKTAHLPVGAWGGGQILTTRQ